MLKLNIGHEIYNEETQEFLFEVEGVLELEHSLAALSKWESIWEVPFLKDTPMSYQEILSYIECMVITPDYSRELLSKLSKENFEQVNKYLNAKMTATWFNDLPSGRKSGETITAELIYYWMDICGIKMECQHWHLAKLFTLIKIHDRKSEKPKPMSQAEAAAQRKQLNAERRAKYNTRG